MYDVFSVDIEKKMDGSAHICMCCARFSEENKKFDGLRSRFPQIKEVCDCKKRMRRCPKK